MHGCEREAREAKRPRGTGGFSGGHASATACYSRGYVSRPVYSALTASSGAPATSKSEVVHFSQPLSNATPARGAFSGSTYLYVSSFFALYLDMWRDSLSSHMYVSTLERDSIIIDHVYRSCLVVIGGFETRANQLLLSMVDFDVTLGMEWLLPHAILDCHAKTMTLALLGFPRLEWRGTLDYIPIRVMSFLKA
ncbi:uncharacterized protein [Nicotiana tomentosiformis]|uniref:uncharacterized protein n=1 Tax=Nicotiana tomentosiformis TaxID=4098 RepID=UPI00388CC770